MTKERQFADVITGELNCSRVKETCEWSRMDLLKFKIVKIKLTDWLEETTKCGMILETSQIIFEIIFRLVLFKSCL